MAFSLDDARAGLTLISFLVFLGIVWWAWSARRKDQFDEAARLALDDDPLPGQGRQVANESDGQQR
ncbi:MAG: cbb3-type cytochrome c oxidase subunit 3 [Betaproteobacteria bacterium]